MQLMRSAPFAALAACLLLSPSVSSAQETGQLDSNPSLFSVLAALNAAGFDADLNSQSNSQVRIGVRKYLSGKNLPSVVEIRRYIRDHRLDGDTALLSRYISFALCIENPPNSNSATAPTICRRKWPPWKAFCRCCGSFTRRRGLTACTKPPSRTLKRRLTLITVRSRKAVLE